MTLYAAAPAPLPTAPAFQANASLQRSSEGGGPESLPWPVEGSAILGYLDSMSKPMPAGVTLEPQTADKKTQAALRGVFQRHF